MRSAFSLDSLIQKLTILVLNAALHFVILAFANRYNFIFFFPFFLFLFNFLSFNVTGAKKGKIKEKEKYFLSYPDSNPGPFDSMSYSLPTELFS